MKGDLISDLNGFLHFDQKREPNPFFDGADRAKVGRAKVDRVKLGGVKLPSFRLRKREISNIWHQLRCTQLTDGDGGGGVDIQSAPKDGISKSAQKEAKYEKFLEEMLDDTVPVDVVMDGANIGHCAGPQGTFSFDFVDHVASTLSADGNVVRIILSQYRCRSAENGGDERVRIIMSKWRSRKWLIVAPDSLYDDVLWAIIALHWCRRRERLMIVTNDTMRDHTVCIDRHDKAAFAHFLQTKVCRIEITGRYHDHDPLGPSPAKRRRIDHGDNRPPQNVGFNKWEFIHNVPRYKIHPPARFTVNPQFYRYPVAPDMEELVWFIPTMHKESDCDNPKNVLKRAFPEHIQQHRVRWWMARIRKKI